MRLWTIQSESAAKVIDDGVWYSTIDYRAKDCDADSEMQKLGYVPIYCFSTLNGDFLNINTFRKNFRELVNKYKLPRTWGDVLIELEVQDEDIISMKPAEAMEHDPTFFYTFDFKKSVNELVEKYRDPNESHFRVPATMECTMECIKRDHVVAIYKFELDKEQDCCAMKTTFTNATVGAPSWSRAITVTPDAQFRLIKSRDSDLIHTKNLYKDLVTLVSSFCSAERANTDMCVKEAIEFCIMKQRSDIITRYNKYLTTHDEATMYNTKISDLQPYN